MAHTATVLTLGGCYRQDKLILQLIT